MKTMTKRATIYFDPELHQALRINAVLTDHSISDIVNNAVKYALAEDREDLAVFEERAYEPSIDFEDVLKDIKQSCKI